MKAYIDKSALVAEIERLQNDEFLCDSYDMATGFQSALRMVQEFINTLEVKDANEALRTEYEKGRADVIAKTLKWLWDLNQQHEIMSYTDSHVLSSDELQKYYKNNIEE